MTLTSVQAATPEGGRPKVRMQWLDAMRGWAIILVVLGHTLLGLISANALGGAVWPGRAVLLIYEVHLPALFFISGYVSRDHTKSFGALMQGQLRFTLYPYVLWSIILVVVQHMVSSGVNTRIGYDNLLLIAWQPVSIYWFLYSFFIIKMIDYTLCRMPGFGGLRGPVAMMVLGAAVFQGIDAVAPVQAANPVPLIAKTGACLYFYGVARLLGERRNWLEGTFARLEQRPALVVAIVLLCLSAIAAVGWVYIHMPVQDLHPSAEPQVGLLFTGTLAIAMLLLVSRFYARGWWLALLSTAGMYSMAIYVMHSIIGGGVRAVLLKLHLGGPALLVAVVILSSVIPVYVQKVWDRFGLSPLFGVRANAG